MRKLVFFGLLCLLGNKSFSQEQDSVKVYDLDELTISATRMNTQLKHIPQKVEIIDETVINSIPSENIAELLKKTTNLDIIQYPGLTATVGMRGFSPSAHSRSYTLLLINGKPSGVTNLAAINTENVARIEVIKGPYSALYGSDAMGGVINVITKTGTKETKGKISIAAGSFGSLKLSGNVSGQLNDKTSFALGYSRNEQQKDYRIGSKNALKLSEQEKLMLDKASNGDIMKNSKYQTNHINGQLDHALNKNWEVSTEVLYTFAHDVETPGNYWGSYTQSKKDIDRLNLYGNIKYTTDKNSLEVSPYFANEINPFYTNVSDTCFVSFKSKVKEYGFKMHDNFSFGDIKFLIGADLDIHDYRSERFQAKATPTNPYSPNHKNTKAALLAQISYSTGGLDINAGARYDNISYDIEKNDSLMGTGGSETYNAFNPSVGVQYTLPINLKFHGSYGTAFSVPEAFKVAGYYRVSEYFAAWNFWWIKNYVGNPDLRPESSATFDLGLNYSFNNRLIYADLTYFQTKHKDKIVEYTYNDTTSYKNANNSNMKGIELLLSSNLGNLINNKFKLELYGNFTFMLENTVDETLTGSTGNDSIVTRDMKYTRNSNGNFGIFFDNYKGFSTRLNARYIGTRLEEDRFSALRPDLTVSNYYVEGGYTAADKILEHPDYLIFDFSVYYTFQKNKRFGIAVSNLLDENYSEKDGYNMPGRFISGNFVYSF